MQGLADNPGIKLLALVVGGFPARYLAAYCETGSLDANMRAASADLAAYYGYATGILGLASIACPPLSVLSALCAAAGQIFKALAKGTAPSFPDVSGLLNVAGPAVSAFSSGGNFDMSKVSDAAGAFAAGASSPDLRAVAGVPALPELGDGPPSCTPASSAERAAKRAIALAAAKAKAKYKTAHGKALACAKVKARANTAVQRGQPVPTAPTVEVVDGYPWHVDPSCAVPSSKAGTPAPTTGVKPAAKKSNTLLYLGAAAVGLKLIAGAL